MAPINTLSFFNGKWPVHVASSNFLINEIHNVLRLNLGGRKIIRNESKIDRRQIAYRGTEGEMMIEIKVQVYKICVSKGLIPCSQYIWSHKFVQDLG